jgi:uncharacterized protein YjbI with pentapeptide repeats
MADPSQLEILKQGTEAWNQWRQQHPDIRPALKEVDLQGVQLGEVNLHGADLRESDLSRASLIFAELRGVR